MTGHRHTALALAALGALVLASCAADPSAPSSSTGTTSAAPEPPLVDLVVTSPTDPLTIVGDATDVDAALRTSQTLFESAPVAVVAPSGDASAQEAAARAAISLGVPLLLGAAEETAGPVEDADAPVEDDADSADEADSADGAAGDDAAAGDDPSSADDAAGGPGGITAGDDLAAELDRLAVATVVVVGDVAPLVDEDDDSSGRTVVRAEPTYAALSALTGLPLDDPAADPAALTAGIVGYAPSPDAAADGDGDSTLPEVDPAEPLTDVVALALDGPEQIAPVATARAAGIAVHLVPASDPNPQAHPGVIEALHASAAQKTLALGAGFATQDALDWKVRSARGGSQLPGGGQLMFPGHQFVAIYGSPITGALGVLGEQPAPQAVQRARDVAAPYVGLSDKTVVPMFEIIATVAAAQAGPDGNYSNEQPVDSIRPWVDEAAAAGIYVVIDLQPGRSDFLSQAKLYEDLLMLPNVGLALDPEWRLTPDQVPLGQIGSVSAAEVNEVVQWLADLTNANSLPPKMLVLHQFQLRMLADRASITTDRPELAVVIHADGQGGQGAKQSTWNTLREGAPANVAWGWKNFYDEDLPMLTPEQTVQGVAPVPDLVTYQ